MSAYTENPQNCSFEGQEADEKTLLLLRAHPITNLPWIILAIFLFFLPFFLPTILSFSTLDLSFVPQSFRLTFLLINYLLTLVVVFEGFLFWYFNVYIVTDKNIVDVNFHSILFKNIYVVPLKNVVDISSSMGGLLQAIFHYGNVFVQTAGATKNIDFIDVPMPHRVADFILDHAHKKFKGE